MSRRLVVGFKLEILGAKVLRFQQCDAKGFLEVEIFFRDAFRFGERIGVMPSDRQPPVFLAENIRGVLVA